MSGFNWSAIDWVSLLALSLLVLVAARIGERLSFGNRGVGALVTTLFFAVGFAAGRTRYVTALSKALR
jgi:hypothetical protein